MSSSRVNLEEYLIPIDDIFRAVNDFSDEQLVRRFDSTSFYTGELSERWQNRKVLVQCFPYDYQVHDLHRMVEMVSTFNHVNITPFLGYCEKEEWMMTIFESPINDSLGKYLIHPDKRRSLTWVQRLMICLESAAGLEYLHSGLGEGRIVVHGSINSENILLDEKLKAKICNFEQSILVDQSQPQVYVPYNEGTNYYLDPLCKEGNNMTTGSDVFSFGVVMFEVLSGVCAYDRRSFGDTQQQTLISFVRSNYDVGLENFIDPYIRDHINIRSFRGVKEIAYQCISWELKDRPTMNTIIKTIQEALDIQNQGDSATITKPSHEHQNLESFVIPTDEILLATQDFTTGIYFRPDGDGKVFKGEPSELWQNRIVAIKYFRFDEDAKYLPELNMVSKFHHDNIISFIGYNEEDVNNIIVYDYAINGSLDQHLHEPEPNKRHCLTWSQRLKICIGIARGLEYLHSGLEEDKTVIHRQLKSKYILLDVNYEAKISNFSLSLIVDRNHPEAYDRPNRTSYYTDPIYDESGLANTKSDLYSFGVILLEMLSGMQAQTRKRSGNDEPQSLFHLVRHHYDSGLDILKDPRIADQIDIHSFRVIVKLVCRCISWKLEDRPTIKRIIKRIEEAQDLQDAASTITTRSTQHLQIPLKDIKLAIKDFSKESPIGDGGYGKVYKAQLPDSWKNDIVAIKCLDPKGHQGKTEFLNEVNLISNFQHQNIIPLVGYCEEGDQMIIVSKYAANGSLDHHLQDPSKRKCLTWARRLKICLGAAKGLEYLHSGLGRDKSVIHRDVKSGNILLNENMEAKICDFGLSRQGSGKQQATHVYTKVAGTKFYLDPLYRESNVLSKASDVYSFGVVLFEMLSGMLAYGPQPLISLVRRYHKDEPEKLIDPLIRDEIDNRSFHTFKELAFQCISLNLRERPTMDRIIDRIEDAIDFQENEV